MNIFNQSFSPRRDPGQLIGWVENSAGCEGVGGAGVGHTFTGVICSCREHRQTGPLERRGTDTPVLELYKCLGTSPPRTSVLLRCGDPEGEGGARVGVRRPPSGSPVAEVEGTAGEATVAVEEEVGRFWKYCSPGSSSSSAPHGYTCGGPITMTAEWNLGLFNNPLRPTQTLGFCFKVAELCVHADTEHLRPAPAPAPEA